MASPAAPTVQARAKPPASAGPPAPVPSPRTPSSQSYQQFKAQYNGGSGTNGRQPPPTTSN